MKLRAYIVALHAALFAILLAVSPAGSGSMMLLGVGKPAAVATGLPLDGLTTGIKAAYSTRKLLTAYAGSAIRVQRTDTTQLDIGFAANVLDTAALASFCSGVTCVVVTWYDQSGGGFDHTNVAASAPIIYQSGAVNIINSKPALLGVSATPTFLANASLNANPVNTLYQNAVIKWTSGDSGIVGSSIGIGSLEWRVDATTGTLDLLKAATASIGTSSTPVTTATGAIVEAQYNSSTGAYSFWVNRSAAGTGTSAHTLTAGTSQFFAGRGSGAESFNGSIGEIILYDLVGGIPGGSQSSITLDQKSFWGTP